MAVVNITTLLVEPNEIAPFNSELWFNSSAIYAPTPDFKYLWDVVQIGYTSSATMSFLGRYKVPPTPDGFSWFSPNKVIASKVSFNLSPFTFAPTQDIFQYTRYRCGYGASWNPNLPYYDVQFVSNPCGNAGLRFDYPHGLQVGDVVLIDKGDKSIHPAYDGTFSVCSVVDDYVVGINTSFISSVAPGTDYGTIRKRFDSFFYNPTYSTVMYGEVGLDFTPYGPHRLVQNDIITIDKDNKFENAQYDGTASVMAVIDNYKVMINKRWGVTPSTANSGGYINNIIRMEGRTNNLITYDGTRQYQERVRDFGRSYSISWPTIKPQLSSVSGGTAAGFLESYERYKPVYTEDKETSSFFLYNVGAEFPIYNLRLRTYDANLTQLDSITYDAEGYLSSASQSTTYYTVGVGPWNARFIFGATALDGATYYDIGLYSKGGMCRPVKRKIVENCSLYETVRLAFKNKNGCYEYWNFNKDSKRTFQVAKTEYKKNLSPTYLIGDRGRTVLKQDVKEEWTVNTDWIDEADYAFLSELITSNDVYWLVEYEDNVFGLIVNKFPIIITDKDYVFKTMLRDRLFNLTLKFEMANERNVQSE